MICRVTYGHSMQGEKNLYPCIFPQLNKIKVMRQRIRETKLRLQIASRPQTDLVSYMEVTGVNILLQAICEIVSVDSRARYLDLPTSDI